MGARARLRNAVGGRAPLIAVAVACGVLASCSDGSEGFPDRLGFDRHDDPLGFSVDVPDGWEVRASGLDAIGVIDPDGTSAALIRARIVEGDLEDWLADEYLATENGVAGFDVVESDDSGPEAARATWTFVDGAGAERAGTAVAVRQGDVATVFTAVAPAQDFVEQAPTLSRILDSFRFVAPDDGGAATGPAPVRYVQWIEPNEGAWAMEVPEGWSSQGGLLREGTAVRATYQLTAPEGDTAYFGGDTTLPRFFVLPTETALSLGFQEGQPTGPGGPIMLSFQQASDVAPNLIGPRFGAVQITGVQPRPDLVEIVQRNPVLPGALLQVSAAEVSFTLADGRLGMLALATYGQDVGDLGGTWYVDYVHGFVAPPERVGEVAGALAHSIATSVENPQWRQGESQFQAQLLAQFQEYLAFSNDLQRQTIEDRWASQDAIAAGRQDVLSGTVRLRDPQTGETFQAAAQNRYYFRVPDSGTLVGVDVDFDPLPEIGLRRLLLIGVDDLEG